MAATNLSTWLKWWIDQFTPTTQEVTDVTIADILRRKRKIGWEKAKVMINSKDTKASIDRTTGELTVTLIDIDGDKTNFSHSYQYYLYDDAIEVTVDDVVLTGGFEYHPVSMDLVFTTARTENDPTVKIKGHIVDLAAATLEAGEMLLLRYATLPTVRDNEFDRLSERIRGALNRQFGSKIIRRR